MVDTQVDQVGNMFDEFMVRREPIVAQVRDKTFKLKSYGKAKTQQKRKLIHAYHQDLTEEE